MVIRSLIVAIALVCLLSPVGCEDAASSFNVSGVGSFDYTLYTIPISNDVSDVIFVLTGNVSSLALVLHTPNGTTVAEGIPGYESDDVHILYIINEPSPGNWCAKVVPTGPKGIGANYNLTANMGHRSVDYGQATFNGLYKDRAGYDDFDLIPDYVSVDVGISVMTPGWYEVSGQLVGNGSSSHDREGRYLEIGARIIKLIFRGLNPGSFKLYNLSLNDTYGHQMDSLDYAYTTKNYTLISPLQQNARLTGEYEEDPVDVNDDGLYDYLTIAVGVEAILPGEYSVKGSLFDVNGSEVVWSMGYGNLTPGRHEIPLDFDGKEIWNHGVDGPYSLEMVVLSGTNLTMLDASPEPYKTKRYLYSQFVDPTYNDKILSGVGQGELEVTVTVRDKAPVFDDRYSYDIVGLNIPPISTPMNVHGEPMTSTRSGYAYTMPGVYLPAKPNNFSVTAEGVANLNIGVRKQQNENLTRTWITSQVKAVDGLAYIETDLLSPGGYHIKIFGDADENVSKVYLTMTSVKVLVINGSFELALNTSGFPSGNYSIDARAINGTFSLQEVKMDGLSLG